MSVGVGSRAGAAAHPGAAVAAVGAQVALHLKHGGAVGLRLWCGLGVGPALIADPIVCEAGACVFAH